MRWLIAKPPPGTKFRRPSYESSVGQFRCWNDGANHSSNLRQLPGLLLHGTFIVGLVSVQNRCFFLQIFKNLNLMYFLNVFNFAFANHCWPPTTHNRPQCANPARPTDVNQQQPVAGNSILSLIEPGSRSSQVKWPRECHLHHAFHKLLRARSLSCHNTAVTSKRVILLRIRREFVRTQSSTARGARLSQVELSREPIKCCSVR